MLLKEEKLKLESSELVSLEFGVSGAGSCWPFSGTAFRAVRRFRRQRALINKNHSLMFLCKLHQITTQSKFPIVLDIRGEKKIVKK